MTIQEVKTKKAKLEEKILGEISKFEVECGLTVTEVKLHHAQRFGSVDKRTIGVDIPIILL
jgi:hypothetical protein